MNTFEQHRVQNQIKHIHRSKSESTTKSEKRNRDKNRTRPSRGACSGEFGSACCRCGWFSRVPVSGRRWVGVSQTGFKTSWNGFEASRFRSETSSLLGWAPVFRTVLPAFVLLAARPRVGFNSPDRAFTLAVGWVSARPRVGFSSPSGWLQLALGRVSLRQRVGVNSPSGGCQLAFVSCAVRPWGGL